MDFNFKIASAAAERWRAHEEETTEKKARVAAGDISAVESAERIGARLERLKTNAVRDQARATEVATAVAELSGAGSTAAPSNLIERIGLERVIGKRDFLNVSFLELALAVSRFVGRINIKASPTRTVGFGTGFMVSPRLLLTNNHVIPSAQDGLHSEVEFDFQFDRFARLLPVVNYGLDPNTFFITDVDLDFTLIAVAERSVSGQVDLKGYGWNRLVEEEGKALIGDSLNIVQHPNGEAKQISLRSNQLLNLMSDFAHYETDTDPGSSGSPVYNDQWEVVALHHSGVPGTDPQGNLLDVDGNIWRAGDDPDSLKWVANEGVRVSKIVKNIKSRKLTSFQSSLRREMLELEPPHPVVAAMRAEDEAQRKVHPQIPVTAVPSAGTVSFTVPLTITVQLGSTQSSPAASAPPELPSAVSTQADPATATDVSSASSMSSLSNDPGYREAVAELERAAQRPYYDRVADEEARTRYYAAVGDVTEHEGSELFRRLHQLLEGTHQNKINYKPSIHVYPWIDLHKSGTKLAIRSIYSGKEFDPRDLIEDDILIERRREQLRESMMRESSFSAMEAQRQSDLLEASLPFNCEHVVPQSWFAKKEPMRGDLHHLFACEVGCNSFRSNIPYFDFPDFEETVRDACGKREGNKFEPVAGKGAVARATLYFMLRYPGHINRTANEYERERIATLLAWHAAQPVDEYELHRNAAIFEKQGNRNPLIDFPDWATRIGFGDGLG